MSSPARDDNAMNQRSTHRATAANGDAPFFADPRLLVGIGAAVACFLVILIAPSIASAVPGSGEFVALDSEGGREITALYNAIAKICLAILIIVEGVLLVAILKFRRKSDDERPVQNHGDLRLEFGWTMGALLIQIWIGVATIDTMFETETLPDEGIDMTVTAEASQWDWDFYYEFPDDEDRGTLTHPDLVVPAHTNVKLQVTSRDVIHAIYIPELGVKIDAVPGRFNHWWFRADGPVAQVRAEDHPTLERPERDLPQTRQQTVESPLANVWNNGERRVTGLEKHTSFVGSRAVDDDGNPRVIEDPTESPYYGYSAIEYQGLCAELCGMDHWDMYFRAVVMTQSSFDRWVDRQFEVVDDPDGEGIYTRRCATCHGDDGTGDDVNPTLVGADRVVNPERKDDHIEIVLQGEGAMQAFGGTLNDDEVAAVINHERTSWGNDGETIEAEDVAEVRAALDLSPFPAADVDPVPTDDLMRTGERLYQSCASCHGADGRSVDPELAPDLAGNDVVVADEPDDLTRILVQGLDSDRYLGKKRPVARGMDDRQLASLLTYLRQSFDNDAPEVQPFDVRDIRDELE